MDERLTAPKGKLLLIDDEQDLLSELKPLLERAGYAVQTANSSEEGLTLIKNLAPDLIVLDVILPGISGRELLRYLRQNRDWTPVILLTQLTKSAERTLGLQDGADDYLDKPFDPLELIARIEAVLRRAYHGLLPLLSFRRLCAEDLVLDRQTRQIIVAGHPLSLSARAIGVLEYLMLHPETTISREEMLNNIWGASFPIETRAVDIRIAELRKVLQDDAAQPRFIKTVLGEGYRFIKNVEGQ